MEQFFIILAEFGLPVAGSFAMGVFIYIILRYILGSVIGQVQTMHSIITCLLYTSPSPRDGLLSRMPSSA